MRTVKNPAVRQNEILDAAEALFAEKGYARTTIHDVLTRVGIAKGTLYHYFASKEDLMEAMVVRYLEEGLAVVERIAADPALGAEEKLRRIVLSPGPETARRDVMAEELHHVGDAELHLRSLTESIRLLAPVITRVVEQGIREGAFATPYPRQVVELLLTGSQFFLDAGVFPVEKNEKIQRAKALAHVLETALGARKGAFACVHARFGERAATATETIGDTRE